MNQTNQKSPTRKRSWTGAISWGVRPYWQERRCLDLLLLPGRPLLRPGDLLHDLRERLERSRRKMIFRRQQKSLDVCPTCRVRRQPPAAADFAQRHAAIAQELGEIG